MPLNGGDTGDWYNEGMSLEPRDDRPDNGPGWTDSGWHASTPDASGATGGSTPPSGGGRRRRTGWLGVGAVAAASLLGAGAVLAVEHDGGSSSSPGADVAGSSSAIKGANVAASSTVATTSSAPLTTTTATGGATLTAAQIWQTSSKGVVDITQTSTSATSGTQESEGSGFVISKDGYIVTNAHVVDATGKVYVSFSNNDKKEATIVGKDESTDVALLKVDESADALVPLTLGDSSKTQPGDEVVAIGNPYGYERTITEGIISATHRSIEAPDNSTITNALQTDAAINHGNSGGPLINMQGQVIGINSQIDSQSGVNANIGIGFAVPINTVTAVVSKLQSNGSVKHAYMGVALSAVTQEQAKALHLPAAGVEVDKVTSGSPAAAAKLTGSTDSSVYQGDTVAVGGDIITAVDGQSVADEADLQSYIFAKSPGDKVKLSVVHANGTKDDVEVTLGTYNAKTVQSQSQPQQQQAPQQTVPGFGLPEGQ
jgi:putative serine protease PepD